MSVRLSSFSSLCSSSFFVHSETGDVYACGRNDTFNLCVGDASPRYVPTKVELLDKDDIGKIAYLAAGYAFTVFVTEKGVIMFVGHSKCVDQKYVKLPKIIPFSKKVIRAFAGFAHSLVLTEDHQIYGFGSGANGELGNGTTSSSEHPLLMTLPLNETPIHATCGAEFSLILTNNGKRNNLYSCGKNNYGQLGNSNMNESMRLVPGLICFPEQREVEFMASGRDHSLALTKDGRVYSWGSNNDGQLGLGHQNGRATPSWIVPLENVVAIACGWCHNLCLTSDGSVFAFGLNNSGQLSFCDTTFKKAPHKISFFDSLSSKVVQIGCGNCHSFVATADHELYTWGYNGYGQLGIGNANTTIIPTLLPASICSQNKQDQKQLLQIPNCSNEQKIMEIDLRTHIQQLWSTDSTDITIFTLDNESGKETRFPVHQSILFALIPFFDSFLPIKRLISKYQPRTVELFLKSLYGFDIMKEDFDSRTMVQLMMMANEFEYVPLYQKLAFALDQTLLDAKSGIELLQCVKSDKKNKAENLERQLINKIIATSTFQSASIPSKEIMDALQQLPRDIEIAIIYRVPQTVTLPTASALIDQDNSWLQAIRKVEADCIVTLNDDKQEINVSLIIISRLGSYIESNLEKESGTKKRFHLKESSLNRSSFAKLYEYLCFDTIATMTPAEALSIQLATFPLGLQRFPKLLAICRSFAETSKKTHQDLLELLEKTDAYHQTELFDETMIQIVKEHKSILKMKQFVSLKADLKILILTHVVLYLSANK